MAGDEEVMQYTEELVASVLSSLDLDEKVEGDGSSGENDESHKDFLGTFDGYFISSPDTEDSISDVYLTNDNCDNGRKVNTKAAIMSELKKIKTKYPIWCAENQQRMRDIPYCAKLHDPVWRYTCADTDMFQKQSNYRFKQNYVTEMERKTRDIDKSYSREINRAIYGDPAVHPEDGSSEYFGAAENYALYGKDTLSILDDGDELALVRIKPIYKSDGEEPDDEEEDEETDERLTDVINENTEDDDQSEDISQEEAQSTISGMELTNEPLFNGFASGNGNFPSNANNFGFQTYQAAFQQQMASCVAVQAAAKAAVNAAAANAAAANAAVAGNVVGATFFQMIHQQHQQQIIHRTSNVPFRQNTMPFLPQVATNATNAMLFAQNITNTTNFIANGLSTGNNSLVYGNAALAATTQQHTLNTFFKETQFMATSQSQNTTTTTGFYERLVYAQMLQQHLLNQTQQAATAIFFQQKHRAAVAASRSVGGNIALSACPSSPSSLPPPPGLTVCGRQSVVGVTTVASAASGAGVSGGNGSSVAQTVVTSTVSSMASVNIEDGASAPVLTSMGE